MLGFEPGILGMPFSIKANCKFVPTAMSLASKTSY